MSESLVMRENLQRQLQEIMSATKLSTGRRTSVRLSRMGSGSADSAPHTPDMSWVGRNGNRRTLEALRYGLIMKKCGHIRINQLNFKHFIAASQLRFEMKFYTVLPQSFQGSSHGHKHRAVSE